MNTNRLPSHPIKDAINLYKHGIDSSHDAPTRRVSDSKAPPSLEQALATAKSAWANFQEWLKPPSFEDFMN